jgi:hypothetical protein
MRYLIIIALLLTGCGQPATHHVVASIGDCTEGTGGWGGTPAKCRVTLTDGKRATVDRPVDVGDPVHCNSMGCYVSRR